MCKEVSGSSSVCRRFAALICCGHTFPPILHHRNESPESGPSLRGPITGRTYVRQIGPSALVSSEDQASLLGLLKKHKTGRFCKTTLSARLILAKVAKKASRLADLRAVPLISHSIQETQSPPRNCSREMISGTDGRVLVPESPSFGTPPVEFGYPTCRIRVRRSAFRVHFDGNGDRFSGDQEAGQPVR